MSSIIKPGSHVFYMKVGNHASETLDVILKRKLKEIESEGIAFWGYGGGTCHPTLVVQPFVKSSEAEGETIYLCMEPMESKHFAPSVRADEFSVDGINWKPIPQGINVTGSRYAVVIKSLREEKFGLPLARTRVALGNSKGATGSTYISGRVDKACLEIVDCPSENANDQAFVRQIGLVAEIAQPYAVFVRNLPK
jgi:hypothetical protein